MGPNGMGKTTIMKLLARRKLPVPDFIDILLVEQEVVGDDRTALESVVAADVELMNLRKRKLELEAAMERVAKAEDKGGEDGHKERVAALGRGPRRVPTQRGRRDPGMPTIGQARREGCAGGGGPSSPPITSTSPTS